MTETRRIGVKGFGIVRGLLQNFTRGQIHQFLLEAGSEAALSVPFTSDMNSPKYRQKEAILSEGLDDAFRTLAPEAANALVFDLIRAMARKAPAVVLDSANGLDAALLSDGVNLAEVLEHGKGEGSKRVAQLAQAAGADLAQELHAKAWGRIETDPSGAITAATSFLESVCRKVIADLGLTMPAKQQLPELLTTIRRESNLDDLFPFGDSSKRFNASVASVAHNAYQLAHDAGDRHGNDDESPVADSELAHVFTSQCDVLGGVLLRALKSGRLVKK